MTRSHAAPAPAPIGRADVWVAGASASSAWRGRLDVLDDEERIRLATITEPTAAEAYAVLHVLARDVLAHVVGVDSADVVVDRTCARCGGPHGQPRVVGHPDVHVSLSRTASLVAVAVSTDAPVGVDVEQVARTDFPGFDDVATHPSERASGTDLATRAVSWVRKEAALKAVGVGLLVDPASVRTPAPGRPAVIAPGRGPVSVADLAVADVPASVGHVAALALAAAYDSVVVSVHVDGPGGQAAREP